MTPPALVYLGMGLLVARILLDGRRTRGLTWLEWLQFLVDAARITLLWPLVLLVEKVSTFLKAGEVEEQALPMLRFPPDVLEEVVEVADIEPGRGEER